MNEILTIIIAVLGTLLALLFLVFSVGFIAFLYIFKRKPFSMYGDEKTKTEKRKIIDEARKAGVQALEKYPPLEKVSISSFDGTKLSGLVWRANSKKVVICVHGYTSNPRREFAPFAPYLHEQGANLIMVSDRAHGDSDGKYCTFSILERHDVLAWINYAVELFGKDSKIFLYGISMGAATVCLVSSMDIPKNVKGVVMDCGFASARRVLKYQIKKQTHLPGFLIDVANIFCKSVAKFDINELDPIDAIKKSSVPFLFFHGSEDEMVPVEMAHELYDACPNEKELKIVEGAEHVGAYYFAKEMYEKTFSDFMNRYSKEKS